MLLPSPPPLDSSPSPISSLAFIAFRVGKRQVFPDSLPYLVDPKYFLGVGFLGGLVVALSPRRKGDTPNTSPLGNKNSPRIRPCTRKVKKTERSSIREAVLFCCRQKTFDHTCPLSHIHLVFMSAFFCTPPCSQSPHPYYTAQRVQNHVPRNSIASSQKRERGTSCSPPPPPSFPFARFIALPSPATQKKTSLCKKEFHQILRFSKSQC